MSINIKKKNQGKINSAILKKNSNFNLSFVQYEICIKSIVLLYNY